MNEMEIDRLLALGKEQLRLLGQLQSLTEGQSELIQGDRVDDLLQLLSQKSELLDSVNQIGSQLGPMRDRLAENDIWRSSELYPECKETFESIRSILGELSRSDERSLALMTEQKELISNHLAHLSSTDEVMHAYKSAQADDLSSSSSSFSLDG